MSEKIKERKRVYIGNDGIVYVDVNEVLTDEEVKSLMKELKEALKINPGKSKILINMSTYPLNAMRSSDSRKMISEEIISATKDPGYAKAAMFGKSVTVRTIASFIVAVSGIKNIKIFPNKEEALKWLKKPDLSKSKK